VFILRTAEANDSVPGHPEGHITSLVAVTPISAAEAMYMLDRLALMKVLCDEHNVGQYAEAVRPASLEYTPLLPPTWFFLDEELRQKIYHNTIGRQPLTFQVWVLSKEEICQHGIQSHNPPAKDLNLTKDKKHTYGNWKFHCLPEDGGVPPPEPSAVFDAMCSMELPAGLVEVSLRASSLTAAVFREVLQRCNATKE